MDDIKKAAEREAFEQWYAARHDAVDFELRPDGQYDDWDIALQWNAWEARAALPSVQVPDYEAKFQSQVSELVMRHIDRMNDVCEEDPADRIIESFTSQFHPIFQEYLDRKFPNRHIKYAAPQGDSN